MSNEEILTKAIEKANKNGYALTPGDLSHINADVLYPQVIFSHDFAKAFWGEGTPSCIFEDDVKEYSLWQYHLTQLVLKEDPLEYIERFL